MCRRRDTKSSDTGIVQACLNTFSRQKVSLRVIAEMAIRSLQLFWFRAETQEIKNEQ